MSALFLKKRPKSVHVFVYVECVGLLREVVGTHSAPHLGIIVFWIPTKYRE